MNNEYSNQAKPVDEQSASQINVNFNELILPYKNILQEYDSVAWRFKLYTISAAEYKNYMNPNAKASQLVICETGVTGKYNIDKVIMTNMPPGSSNTKNSTMMKTDLTISESGSMTFFDDLQLASDMLGYGQLMNVPLFLELSFVGYDNYREHLPVVIPESTRLWRLHLNKINTRVDNNGGTTVYEIETSPLSFMIDYNDWSLSEQMEITSTKDVGTLIADFSTSINNMIKTQYGYLTYMFPNELQNGNFFTFNVHPKLKSLPLVNDSEQDAAKDKVGKADGAKRFVFEAGKTIGSVIDNIMDSAKANSVISNKDNVDKRQFVNVIPISHYVGFDKFRKKHVYRYEIYVVPYYVFDYQDVDDTKNSNTAFDLKRLFEQAQPNTKFNMKKYDYQWSGLNTEILKLNFDFNHAYNMIAARNITSLFDQYNSKGIKVANLKANDTIVSAADIQQIFARKIELDTKQGRSDSEENELQQNNNLLEKHLTVFEGEKTQLKNTNGEKTLLESVTTEQYLADYVKTTIGSKSKIEVAVDYRNVAEVSSNTNDSNASQTEVAKRMIRSNYYNDAFLLKLEMQVVGDLYWLGKSEYEIINDLKKVVNNEIVDHSNNQSLNSIDCEACLLLNLKPAKGYDYRTGLAKDDTNSVFAQTVYRVLNVVSTFSNEGFKQDITANIIARSLNRKK